MKTVEYMKQLARGSLRNTTLSVLRNGTEGYQEEFEQVCTMINEGLVRLYNRFIIKENSVLIEMQPGVTNYHLLSMYSVTGADPLRVPRPYIMDLPNEPFLEDVIKVLSVVDGTGVQRPLNDHSRTDSIFTPQSNVIQNLFPKDFEVLGVTYQASPANILVPGKTTPWSGDTEFYLPDCLLPGLTAYVSYLYYLSVGTPESVSNASIQIGMYEEICREVDRMDLVNQSLSNTNTRFSRNGWK